MPSGTSSTLFSQTLGVEKKKARRENSMCLASLSAQDTSHKFCG